MVGLCLLGTSGTGKSPETFTSYTLQKNGSFAEDFALQLAGRRQKQLLQNGLQQVCPLRVEILALLLEFLQFGDLVLDALNLFLC